MVFGHRAKIGFDALGVPRDAGFDERIASKHAGHELVERRLVIRDPSDRGRRGEYVHLRLGIHAEHRGKRPDVFDPHVRVNHHALRLTRDLHEARVSGPGRACPRHRDRWAHRIGDQVCRSAHSEPFLTVFLVSVRSRRDRHVDIVVGGAKPSSVLVFLDPRDIDQKRNPRYVVQLQRGVGRVIGPPAIALVRAELGGDVDVRAELSPRKACSFEVRNPMAGRRAHTDPFSAASAPFQCLVGR